MASGERLALLISLCAAFRSTRLVFAQPVQVLLLHRAVPNGTRLQGFDVAVEKYLPAAKRPLICESWVLATMPHEERKQFMERRLFAAVAQLQPLAPWLASAALAAELDFELCFSLRALSDQAKSERLAGCEVLPCLVGLHVVLGLHSRISCRICPTETTTFVQPPSATSTTRWSWLLPSTASPGYVAICLRPMPLSGVLRSALPTQPPLCCLQAGLHTRCGMRVLEQYAHLHNTPPPPAGWRCPD